MPAGCTLFTTWMSWLEVIPFVTVLVLVKPLLSVIEPLFTICVPLFSGLFTVTLKLTLPLAPGFWLPRLQVSGFGPLPELVIVTGVQSGALPISIVVPCRP